MSLPPEDRPTEPLRPRAPVDVAPAVARDAVDAGWAVRIEDQLRSLKSMLALVGVLALAALGLALYDLLRDDDDGGDRTGASRERVAQIDQRVDRLESKAGGASEESDVARLQEGLEGKAEQSDVEQLGADVEELRGAVEAAGSGDSAAEDVAALSERLEELAAEVDELREESAQQP